MMRRKTLVCALALALCAWAPTAALAEGQVTPDATVEQDTQTEELEIGREGEGSDQGQRQNSNTSSPATGDEVSPMPLAFLVAGTCAIAVGVATGRCKSTE